MILALKYVHAINAPKSLDGRKSFYFNNALSVEITDNNDNNYTVIVTSNESPRITYSPKPHTYKQRPAEDEDLKEHCIRKENVYIFPQAQRNGVEFGKSWF